MNAHNADALTIKVVAAGLIVCILLAGYLIYTDEDFLNVLSALDSVASIVGLIVVILQIQQLKRVTDVTQQAIVETQEKLRLSISIAEVARTIEVAQQVQRYAGQKNYELARIRLQEVRSALTQLMGHPDFSQICKVQPIEKINRDIGIHLTNLFSAAYAEGKTFDATELNKTLEGLISALNKFQQHLKFPQR